jgi:hypothetical protein
MRDKTAVKLEKPNKAGDIADQLRDWSVTQQVVLRHSGAIPILGNINANKFEPLWEEVALFETEAQAIRLTDL